MTAETEPQISIADLSNILKVIDAAAERGAFRGSELTPVGSVRDKLAAFLAAVKARDEANGEDENAETAASEENKNKPATPSKKGKS